MEFRPPRSRPVTPQQPFLPALQADDKEECVDSEDLPTSSLEEEAAGDDFQFLGATRVMKGPEHGRSGKTQSPDDTDILVQKDDPEKEKVRLGDFELIRKLGEGAMGRVYLARQISFDREVALKVLFKHVAKNHKLVQRLDREALAMEKLDHPNIVKAFEVNEVEGFHYVAMEFIDGHTLKKWLDRLGRFGVADALSITLDCARALEYAHNEGIIHRDIKPDNVLIDRHGFVKIADLGLVKTLDHEDAMSLTQTGHAVGTPWYMPLEQAKMAKDADGRCDIYALGCMLYCLLTGNPPFTGRTIVEVIQAKEVGTFPPARRINQDVSERLDLIIAKMTAKLPGNRYQNCTELIKDMQNLDLAATQLAFLADKTRRAPPDKEAVKLPSSADTIADAWYVQISLGEGKIKVLPPVNTGQLKKMVEEGTIHPSAKASRHSRDGFRALATFKEFQGTALVKQTKQAADMKSVKINTLIKKIEEQEWQRDQSEKNNEPDPAYYSLLWKPGLIAGAVLTGGGLFFYVLYRLFS